MIRLRSAREEEVVWEAIAHPEDAETSFGLFVDGEDVGAPAERNGGWKEGTWGQDEIPIALDCTIADDLPDRLDGGEVRLFVEMEGVLVPQLLSGPSEFVPGAEYGLTDLIAHSPGALFGGPAPIKMGEYTEYVAEYAERIAFSVAKMLPYDRSRLRIDPMGEPALTFGGSQEQPGFQAEEPTGGVVSRLEESVGYLFRDDVYRGTRVFVPQPLAVGQEVHPLRRFSAAEIKDWIVPRRAGPRFYDVRVFKRLRDGTLAFDFRERVSYHGPGHRPLPGQTLDIVIDADEDTGSSAGRRRAVRQALEEGRALYSHSLTFPRYDPLTEAEDRFSVVERHEEDGAIYERLWLAKIAGYAHGLKDGDDSGPSTGVNYAALIAESSRIDVPTLIVPRGSSTRVKSEPEGVGP